MATRKLQVYLTESEYRFLKHEAGPDGSMAAVIRRLIDEAGMPTPHGDDPFYRHITQSRPGSGDEYDAEEAKRALYGRPR